LQLHKLWKERYDIAKKSMEDIGVNALRQLLGDEFEPITTLSWICSKNTTPATRNAASIGLAPAIASTVNMSPNTLPLSGYGTGHLGTAPAKTQMKTMSREVIVGGVRVIDLSDKPE
jgi:hypothetical protein